MPCKHHQLHPVKWLALGRLFSHSRVTLDAVLSNSLTYVRMEGRHKMMIQVTGASQQGTPAMQIQGRRLYLLHAYLWHPKSS